MSTSASQQSKEYKLDPCSASPFRHIKSTRESFAVFDTKNNSPRIARSYKNKNKQKQYNTLLCYFSVAMTEYHD